MQKSNPTKRESTILFSQKFHATPFITKKNKKNPESESGFRSTLIILFLSGTFIILIAFLGEYGILAHQIIIKKEIELKEEIEKLNKKEQTLLQEINALQNDPSYLETLARKELGLVKKNEVIYFFPPKNGKTKLEVGSNN